MTWGEKMATKRKIVPDWAYDMICASTIELSMASKKLGTFISTRRMSGDDLAELLEIKSALDMARSPFGLVKERTDDTDGTP